MGLVLVDKVNVQTCYYFTCSFQVAWFFLVEFWENEVSEWIWQFRFLDIIWHHTKVNLNLLQHCCDKWNLSHWICLNYSHSFSSFLFTVNIISLLVETSRILMTEYMKLEHYWPMIDWLICNWVQIFMVPMRLGLNWWALRAPYKFMGALLLY
jgi:hypothetical protein